MKTFLRIALLTILNAIFATTSYGQGVELSVSQYEQMKAEGALPVQFHVAYTTLPTATVTPRPDEKPRKGGQGLPKGGGGTNGVCNCWIEPDGNYTLAMAPNDDNSSGLISLPFDFNLYGEMYNTCYINNNGNVSFVSPYGTYSASGFPSADFKMTAPFWADVDTRGEDGNGLNGGTVKYLITNTALYVNWTEVGYFASQTDKHNTFQLIITDGTDPVIGVGNNVSFCYKDMEWTTGSASQGIGGFGGTPSTTGANRGNGIDFIQFTRQDHPGADYDGPFGVNDGIDWLDFQNFRFTTAVSTQNIPPITSSNFLCDTVEVCMGELVNFDVTFLTPEGDQSIINTTASGPTIDNFASTVTNLGTSATINVQFIPTIADTGYHVVTFTGQDNGADSLISTVTIVLAIYYTPAPPPIITGDTVACPGEGVVLTAGGGYDDYIWTNGFFGPVILVGPGTYLCLATSGNCRLASNSITVDPVPGPSPFITGAQVACGGVPSILNTDQPYETYNWSTTSQDASITVGTGTYSVTVTNEFGCEGTSAAVNVVSANDPVASFTSDNAPTVFPGITIQYTNQSTIDGGIITGYSWFVDTTYAGNGQSISQLFETPGQYTITLTVTTAQGCSNTFTFVQTVIPTEIIIPNVFSPNNDNQNDALNFSGVEYYENTKLQVFNRWGNEVFASANYKNTWRPANEPEGTYFYILKMENGKEYTGHVTLLR